MYDLIVAEAHTFFVGEQQWLVHNCDFVVYPDGTAIPKSKTVLENGFQEAGFTSYPNTRTAESGTNYIDPETLNIYRVMDGSTTHPPRLMTHSGTGSNPPLLPNGAPIGNLRGRAVRDATHFLLEP